MHRKAASLFDEGKIWDGVWEGKEGEGRTAATREVNMVCSFWFEKLGTVRNHGLLCKGLPRSRKARCSVWQTSAILQDWRIRSALHFPTKASGKAVKAV